MNSQSKQSKDVILKWVPGLAGLARRYWPKLPADVKPFYGPDDMLQELICLAMKHMRSYDPDRASPGTYIMSCARNDCIIIAQRLSSQKRSADMRSLSDENLPSRRFEGWQLSEAISIFQKFLQQCSPKALDAVGTLFRTNNPRSVKRSLDEIRSAAEQVGLRPSHLRLIKGWVC